LPKSAHLVAGFGRINDLKPEQFLTDLTNAEGMLEAEESAVAHMNADHLDALNLYATKLLGAEAGDWHCTGCDPDGLDLQNGTTILRLDFPRRIAAPNALRMVLKELAEQARAMNG
jgi:putative heme iron utilization protein